ncbi:MAG: MEDS domain-containing protein [Planctomycetota bacterium]
MLSKSHQSGRKTGIDILGDVPWGTHLCLFYETEKDLIDILVPYFKAGLESNEFCVWVTSEPLTVKKAKDALSVAVPDFDRYLEKAQIEIIPHDQWYLKDGVFDLQRVLRAWIDKIAYAISAGFDGIRVTGNIAWLEAKDWENFADHERQVDSEIDEYQMLAICSYPLNKCSVSEILDVISSHGSALIRRQGMWELIESTGRKKAEKALKVNENKYKTLLENLPQKIFLKDTNSVYVSCNENYAADLKIKAAEIAGKTDYDFFPEELAEKYRADDKRIMKSGKTEDINEKYVQRGKEVFVHTVKTPVKDGAGNVIGILGIFWDITAQRQAQKRLLDYQKRLRDLTSEMSLTEERERRRITVELHDQITQQLILFKINLGSLPKEQLPSELAKSLDGIYRNLDRIIGDTRTLTFDLSSPTLYELGLEAAIREWLHEEVQEKHKIHTEFEDDEQPKPLNDDVRALLYRAVRELLVNVVKHAQAQNVKVSIGRDNDKVRIEVADDGVGFIPSPQLNKTGGFGLFSIRERLNYLGGSIDIESKTGQGTHITLIAPIKREKTENNSEVDRDNYEHKDFSGG